MKKIFTLLLLTVTLASSAQSTLLRLNYNKGERYDVKMNMVQNMAAAGVFMNMNIEMAMEVKDVKKAIYDVEMKIKKMTMDMKQGAMEMSYDSTKKEADLDDKGKQMKAQMDPMLSVTIFSEITNLGKVLETKVTPDIPSAAQFKKQSNGIVYPEKAVKVGDTWTMEKNENGVQMNFTYKVKSITNTTVQLDVTGTIAGIGKGTITGDVTIDKSTGVPTKSTINMDMEVQGQKVKTSVEMTTEKI